MSIVLRKSDCKVVDNRAEFPDHRYPDDKFKLYKTAKEYMAAMPDCAERDRIWDVNNDRPREMTEQERVDRDATEAAAAVAKAQAAADIENLPPVEKAAFKNLQAQLNAIITVIKAAAPTPAANLETKTPAQLRQEVIDVVTGKKS